MDPPTATSKVVPNGEVNIKGYGPSLITIILIHTHKESAVYIHSDSPTVHPTSDVLSKIITELPADGGKYDMATTFDDAKVPANL
jgi:hypothetical protein